MPSNIASLFDPMMNNKSVIGDSVIINKLVLLTISDIVVSKLCLLWLTYLQAVSEPDHCFDTTIEVSQHAYGSISSVGLCLTA
jgi:hypothetical protein